MGGEPVRIAVTVPPFMVRTDDGGDGVRDSVFGEPGLAVGRVILDDFVLLSGQRAGPLKQACGNEELADIVESGRGGQYAELWDWHAQPCSDAPGDFSRAPLMFEGTAVQPAEVARSGAYGLINRMAAEQGVTTANGAGQGVGCPFAEIPIPIPLSQERRKGFTRPNETA